MVTDREPALNFSVYVLFLINLGSKSNEMRNRIVYLALTALVLNACNSADNSEQKEETPKTASIKKETVTYEGDSTTMKGYIAYDENAEDTRPAVLIIPEWWGVTDYVRGRADQLADLGYVAMVVDMYGNGQVADNPDDAGKLATPFYQDPAMMQRRFDAALAKLKTNPKADTSKIAAIGYCFGGNQVLNLARLGENLDGVVSFHGNLLGVPAEKNKIKADILVCHGNADPFIKPMELEKFKRELDSVGAAYTFKGYDDATHAFTNPDATEKGKKFNIPIAYNAAADSASWNEMKAFFGKIFR